ncbi:MAG: M14 family zinc carboxypeptidase, partial [Flavobacteriales bacterium]
MKLRRQVQSLFTDVRCRLSAAGMGCVLLAWTGCATSTVAPKSSQPLWSVDSLTQGNLTPTWHQAVEMCQALAASDARVTFHEVGTSDVGRPIHALVVTEHRATKTSVTGGVEAVKQRLVHEGAEKVRVLVNNAIHPGEPCGVNASLALVQSWLNLPMDDSHPLATSSWVFIPQYNVGGASRRNCCTRANQDGPEGYGFRGNAANLDLNRDFIKMDSRNAEAFVALFRTMDPDVFVDTHTSNGADYPYTMTLITTQEDKAGPVLGPFLREKMTPALNARMQARGWPMVP